VGRQTGCLTSSPVKVRPDTRVQAMAEALRYELEDGDTVLFLREYDPADEEITGLPPDDDTAAEFRRRAEEMIEQRESEWQKAFKKGSGLSVEVVSMPLMATYSDSLSMPCIISKEFAEALQRHPEARAWVSLVGPPVNEKGEFDIGLPPDAGAGKSLPAVLILEGTYDAAKVRKWIEDRLLTGVAVVTGWDREKGLLMGVYTRDNAQDLPDHTPPAR